MAVTTFFLAGCAGMALMAAAVDAALPRSRRSWWRAQPRVAFAPRLVREAVAAPAAEDVIAPTAASPVLQLVETVDRRALNLPFVGRERRRIDAAEADETQAVNDR